jgi:hypothetical protein
LHTINNSSIQSGIIMIKYFFAVFIFLHGLIHLMGFAKAFGYGNITQLTKDISKLAGFFWLITAVLFIAATILFLLKKESWPVVAIIAAVISQLLIITEWKDTRFGTIGNLVVVLVAVPALAAIGFNNMAKKEAAAMLSTSSSVNTVVTKEMLYGLPQVVQKWLMNSGVVGKEKIHTVRLKQTGEMRTKPNGKWMPFTATQYFTVDSPAFNWSTTMQMMPMLSMNGRDKFENGKGAMLIKVLGLVNVVNEKENDQINQSSMMRYLAEMCWFPSAALAGYITWEAVDSTSAKATMQYKGVTVSGVFQFDSNGNMISFSGDRWYGSGNDATLQKWFVETNGYATFHGIRIPGKSEVSWKLDKGDFNWLYVHIVDIEYNKQRLYK